MALTKITYDNKVALNPQPSVANTNKCTDSDLNEIKSVVNSAIDQVDTNTSDIGNIQTNITNMQTITEGVGTPNNTYVSSVENNKWTRYGDIVCFGFIIATNNTWDLTSVIFTGLPKAKNGFRFMGLWANNTTPLRLEITENGELKNSWGECPTGSQTVEAYVSYITKD